MSASITAGTVNNNFVIGNGFDGMVYIFKTQTDGKILVGGNFSSYDNVTAQHITRLNQDGSLDETFVNGSFLSDYVKGIDVLSDGKILVGGLFQYYNGSQTNYFVKLNSDGTLNQQFPVGFNNNVRVIKVQSDDKILVGGIFTSYNGNNANYLIRLNSNGTIDNTFNIGNGFNDEVYSIQIESDGNILVGGKFTSCDGISANRIIRLSQTGTIINTFGSGADNRVQKITLQPNGKILLGGQFTNFNGINSNYMVSLNVDGSIDQTFDFNDWVNDMYVQSDGKIVVGGRFDSYDGNDVNYIARITPNGVFDSSFYQGDCNNTCGFNNYPNAIIELSDGNLLIGGWFEQYIGENYNYIISLNNDQNSEYYPFVYEATFCPTNPNATFVNTETFYVGSNVELTGGQVISVNSIFSPTQVQCVQINGSIPVGEIPSYYYSQTYNNCEACLSANSMLALVQYCTDPETTFPIAVNTNYKIGDILIIDYPFYIDDGGVFGVFLNDAMKIVDISPWSSSHAALPKIVDYQPKISCESAQSILGKYYGYIDCNAMEFGWIKSNQVFDMETTIFLNEGSSNCKTVVYSPTVIEDNEQDFNEFIEGARSVVSTKTFKDCAECNFGSNLNPTLSWQESFDGDGAIDFISSTEVDIIGPNDGDNSGWSYIYVQMPCSGTLSFEWSFTNDDEPGHDNGFYYVSQDEPSGDINIDFEANIIGEEDGDTGSVYIEYSQGDWVSIGVYADDSCCGVGILSVLFTQLSSSCSQLLNFTTCLGQSGQILVSSDLISGAQGIQEIPYGTISTSGLDLIENGSYDDDYFVVNLPENFEINFLTSGFTSVNVSSNPFITFGDPNSGQPDNCCFDIPNEIPTDVELPGVFLSFSCPNNISDYDAEMYQLYTGLIDDGNTFVIKYIGSDHCDEIATLVYGFKFYKNNPDYFDLIIEENTSFFNNDPTGGISNGIDTTWVYSFDSSPEKAYRIGSSLPTVKANFGTSESVCGTISQAQATGGSMYFDGNTNTTVNYSVDMDLNFGSWSIEWFQYNTSTNSCCNRVFDIGSFNQEHVGVSLENGNIVVWLEAGNLGSNWFVPLVDPIDNTWCHFAITAEDLDGTNRTIRVFQNGNLLDSWNINFDLNNFDGPVQLPLTIGSEGNGNSPFQGYITNFRWNKGTCYYTSNFTVPTSPLSVNGSQLLLLATDSNTVVYDSSDTQNPLTQNNVTWSNKTPFGSNTLYYYDGGTTYEDCNSCNQMYTITLKNIVTNEIGYLSFKATTLEFMIDPVPITGNLGVECFEILEYVLYPTFLGEYDPAYFYETYQDCLQPFSAGTEYTLCVKDCDGNLVELTFPHPTWTNNYGHAIVLLDAVGLGGPNGLNN